VAAVTGPPGLEAADLPEPSIGRIPALDGVRAIGIILVLFFHGGVGWAGGGFFGVDVFFVLSGFLITGLLVSEFRQNAHIGLRRFWVHRIRRLVPALLAMLLGVAVYGVFFATSDTLGQLRGDAVATLLYGNNWHQISAGTGYFADLNTPRPLLHTWSLSIEEQFYLVWPLVVLGLLHWTRSLRILLTVTVVGAVASALGMAILFHGGIGESRVYYGTDTRAQALLIGAALAIVLAEPLVARGGSGVGPSTRSASLVRSFRLTPLARAALIAAGAVGLAVVGWMAVTDSSATAWIYHGGFALIAVATALVVASVSLVPDSPWTRALSLRPVRYIGAISYGLYLWHWPVFVLLDHQRTGLSGWPLFAVRVSVAVGVAAISYHVLEMPIRRGVLRGWRGWVAAPLAVGGTAVLVVASTAGATPAVDAAALNAVPAAARSSQEATGPSTPAVPAGTGGQIRYILLGDSEASFLAFGLGPNPNHVAVHFGGDGVFGCGFLLNPTMFHGTLVSQAVGQRGGKDFVPCNDQLTRWKADVEAFHPDVVVLEEGEYEVRNQFIRGTWTHIGEAGFNHDETQAMNKAIATLRSTGATVVLLTAPYYHQTEQANGAAWPEDDPARVDTYNRLLHQVAAGSGGGVVVENLNAHLDPGGHYTQFINGVNARFADGIHVSPAGAALVAPWLLTQILTLGNANRAAQPMSTTATSGVAASR
jgi:peptidoglycan/LPS O-acetylase OafA/YrhL